MKTGRLYILAAAATALFFANCKIAQYPIDDPAAVKVDTRLIGNWKVNKKNEKAVYVLSRQDDYHYTVFALEGGKRSDKSMSAFLSSVGNASFMNVYNAEDTGYLFLRILDINAAADKITVATVADSTMLQITSAAGVRAHIATNLANPKFYDDTVQFLRVK